LGTGLLQPFNTSDDGLTLSLICLLDGGLLLPAAYSFP
jgi:hypothetical protein